MKNHRPGTDHQTPARDSKGWIRVVNRGCGGDVHHTMDGPDYYCRHDYTWCCEECPIGILNMEREYFKWVVTLCGIQGPPREVFSKDHCYDRPTVESELSPEDMQEMPKALAQQLELYLRAEDHSNDDLALPFTY